jgi:hypothetical protein
LISDGNVCRSEIETLQNLRIEPELGLAEGAFAQVVHRLCEDLLTASYGGASLVDGLDDDTLAVLLAEVTEPALQAKVMHFISATTGADQHLAEGEARVVEAAQRHWRIALPQPVPATALAA